VPNRPTTTSRAVRRALPLQLLLPLLTTAVVAGALSIGLVVTWATLRSSALDTARDRLTRAVHQLATVSASGVQQTKPRYAAVTHNGEIRRALAAGPAIVTDTVQSLLKSLITPADSGMPVELWSADGRRVAFAGTDVQLAIDSRPRPELPADHPALPRDGLDSIKPIDSLQFGQVYASNGRVYLWSVAPVVDRNTVSGYVLQQRRYGGGPQVERTLRELSGTSVSGYLRNADGKFWTTLGGTAVTPPRFSPAASIVSEERIPGTSLVYVLELPRQAILAAPAAVVRRLAMLAIGLALAGSVLAWLIGRWVATPIGTLTRAAESVASGDYQARVDANGPDEVLRLSASFNNMAAQIGAAAAELEQREAEFRAMANAIPQLAWMAHADGSIFWYNQRWYEYTGTTLEQMEGWGWQSVHDPARLPEVVSRWRSAIAAGRLFEMEFTLRGANGTDRWFLTRVEPVRGRDGEVARWFGTNTDIQDLREARESARAASRAKSDFLTTMSHELRTPLNAIGGYTELLEMELRGPITDAQRRDLVRIRTSQQHLLGLISSMLDMSRSESGKLPYHITTVPIDPLLGGLDALVAPQAAARRMMLEYLDTPPGLAAIADREKLRQILLNLLSNAIRYTQEGGHVAMVGALQDEATVVITVCDNGPGIPLDQQEAIFEPFVQLDRSFKQTREGIGLGLSISRDLARGMNGDLVVDSQPGKGACFILTLPRGTIEDAPVAVQSGEMPAVAHDRT
jgi:PAS domain S-box-containing protein